MIIRCSNCGHQFQSDDSRNVTECPSCGNQFRIEREVRAGTEWDRAVKGAWLTAFIDTLKQSILDPKHFFEEVKSGRGWHMPMIYAIVIALIASIIVSAYKIGFQMMAVSMGALSANLFPFAVMSLPFSISVTVVALIFFVPLGMILALLINAGIYHLCLMIFDAAKRDFMATFRVVCYSVGPQIFQIVPVLGAIAAWIWQIVLNVIGLKATHETTTGKAAFAVLLPTILCCGCAMMIFLMVAGAVFAALQTGTAN